MLNSLSYKNTLNIMDQYNRNLGNSKLSGRQYNQVFPGSNSCNSLVQCTSHRSSCILELKFFELIFSAKFKLIFIEIPYLLASAKLNTSNKGINNNICLMAVPNELMIATDNISLINLH